MPFERLPETVQTLYAELLDQAIAAEAEAAVAGMSGSFVQKQIGGARYWYLQRLEGERKRQIYIGRNSPALLRRIRAIEEKREELTSDENRRRELVSMLIIGGMARESAAVGQVLRILAEAHLFRLGGVLVGTQAYACCANLLGVRFDAQTLRTADIDLAHDPAISLGLKPEPPPDLLEKLRAAEPRFVAVPGFDSRDPSTSFKVRGRDLRVDFLTPARTRNASKPVHLTTFGVAAHPLAGLDYLIEETELAVVLTGSAILVNVPAPAHLALHKLWVAHERPASEQAKSRKDVRQAAHLLEVLVADRLEDVDRASEAIGNRRSMARAIRSNLGKLHPSIGDAIRRRLP